ncbi:MAG: phenylalanine--tRNA ligase subunit beta, partial [Treponema sp.]|nr:phenylalanine--tRNA ligase subunit beta [Treponema sp.]
YVERMGIDGSAVVRITNPMSESFEYVRNSPLPGLLGSEAVSSRALYPHRIFEVGKVAFRNSKENYGVSTRQMLGFLSVHANAQAMADFNEAASQTATLMYYLGRDFELEEADDPRFIPGRQARITYKGAAVGVYGELHPRVLEAWGIAVPCAAAELDLDSLIE